MDCFGTDADVNHQSPDHVRIRQNLDHKDRGFRTSPTNAEKLCLIPTPLSTVKKSATSELHQQAHSLLLQSAMKINLGKITFFVFDTTKH